MILSCLRKNAMPKVRQNLVLFRDIACFSPDFQQVLSALIHPKAAPDTERQVASY